MRQIPAKKVGTPFQRPDWRSLAVAQPYRYGLRDFITMEKPEKLQAKALARLVNPLAKNGKAEFVYPVFLEDVCKGLPPTLALKLREVYRGKWKSKHARKLTVDQQKAFSWKLPLLHQLKDVPLRRWIEHTCLVKYDRDVVWAVNFKGDKETAEQSSTMGRTIFAGFSDMAISLMWGVTVPEVATFRQLFYDFSSFPAHRTARLATLRQMVSIHLLTDQEYELYKMIFDLGPLALKVETDLGALTDGEKELVDKYIKNTYIANVLNLHKAIRVKRDALDYHNTVTSYARMMQQGEYLNQLRARTSYFDIMTEKARKELGTGTANIQEEDKAMLELIRAGQFVNYEFKPRTFDQLAVETLEAPASK